MWSYTVWMAGPKLRKYWLLSWSEDKILERFCLQGDFSCQMTTETNNIGKVMIWRNECGIHKKANKLKQNVTTRKKLFFAFGMFTWIKLFNTQEHNHPFLVLRLKVCIPELCMKTLADLNANVPEFMNSPIERENILERFCLQVNLSFYMTITKIKNGGKVMISRNECGIHNWKANKSNKMNRGRYSFKIFNQIKLWQSQKSFITTLASQIRWTYEIIHLFLKTMFPSMWQDKIEGRDCLVWLSLGLFFLFGERCHLARNYDVFLSSALSRAYDNWSWHLTICTYFTMS